MARRPECCGWILPRHPVQVYAYLLLHQGIAAQGISCVTEMKHIRSAGATSTAAAARMVVCCAQT